MTTKIVTHRYSFENPCLHIYIYIYIFSSHPTLDIHFCIYSILKPLFAGIVQMADPLTALLHAVRVMNLLKTLVLKALREREESNLETRQLASCSDSPTLEADRDPFPLDLNREESIEQTEDSSATSNQTLRSTFSRTCTLGRIEWNVKEKLWISKENEYVSGGSSSTPSRYEIVSSENRYRRRLNDSDHWLKLRKKMHKLWRHPVFQLSKASKKLATSSLGFVNSRN